MRGNMEKKPSFLKLQSATVEAAHAAGLVLMRHFRKKLTVSEKPGAGLVSNADLASEAKALKVLKSAFPDFGVLTEESGAEKSKSLGRWILDPLDGTTNYVHGLPHFCVSIAAEWDGVIVAGAIFHPTLKDTYTAIKGKGAFVNGKKMQVSSTKNLKDCFLSTGFSSNRDRWLNEEIETFEHLSRTCNAVRRPGAAALDLAYIARGSFDGFWERGLSYWDVAAGSLMIEEAGGRVTDLLGGKIDGQSSGIITSNGLIHTKLMNEICLKKSKKNAGKKTSALLEI
jgi:myo-inositol-1(or 4)-monophosphatase